MKFPKKVMATAFADAAQTHHKAILVKKKEISEWSYVMQERLQKMITHLNIRIRKKVSWGLDVVGAAESQNGDGEEEGGDQEDADDDDGDEDPEAEFDQEDSDSDECEEEGEEADEAEGGQGEADAMVEKPGGDPQKKNKGGQRGTDSNPGATDQSLAAQAASSMTGRVDGARKVSDQDAAFEYGYDLDSPATKRLQCSHVRYTVRMGGWGAGGKRAGRGREAGGKRAGSGWEAGGEPTGSGWEHVKG